MSERSSTLQRLLRWALWLAVIVAVLPLPTVAILDAGFSTDVQLLATKRPPEEVQVWRDVIWSPSDPVALIYGELRNEPLTVLLLSDEGVIRPPEAPSQTLLYIDHTVRSDPWTVRMAYNWAIFITIAAALAALAIAALRWFLRRRQSARDNQQ